MTTQKDQTITFTDDVKVLDHNKKVEFSAKRGDVKTMNAHSAAHWLNRNKALPGDVDISTGDAKPEGPSAEEQLQGADDAQKKAAGKVEEAQAELDKLSAGGKTPDKKAKTKAEGKLTRAKQALEKADQAVETALESAN